MAKTSGTRNPSEYFTNRSRTRTGELDHLISFRVSDDLIRRIALIANAEGLSMSDALRTFLERGLVLSASMKSASNETADTPA